MMEFCLNGKNRQNHMHTTQRPKCSGSWHTAPREHQLNQFCNGKLCFPNVSYPAYSLLHTRIRCETMLQIKYVNKIKAEDKKKMYFQSRTYARQPNVGDKSLQCETTPNKQTNTQTNTYTLTIAIKQ